MFRLVLRCIRWLLLFSCIFALALVATMPVNTFLRLLQEYRAISLPLEQPEGYLWRGQATLPYSGLDLGLDWQLCTIGQAPYLGLCWSLREGEAELSGRASTLNGQNLLISELGGNLQLSRLIQSSPQLEMLSLFNIDGTLQIDINAINVDPSALVLNNWDGIISLIEMQLPGLSDLPRIDVILRTGRLNTNRREHANLGDLPQFELAGGNDNLRVEGGGFITPERKVSFEVTLQTTDRQLQSTLRLVARPVGNDRFRLAWDGSY